MKIKLYGIPNCDSVRKARRWLSEQGIDYIFHDFRKDGLSAATLKGWVDAVGWETLLNRRGTTWRQLSEPDRTGIDGKQAIRLMLEQPTLIKRPVLEAGTHLAVGFSADRYQTLLH